MVAITFITGNSHKAETFARYMGKDIRCMDFDLDEIQSLSLLPIVKHKLEQAYLRVGRPILVEDTAFSLDALGKFPGPFIKWMMKEVTLEDICRLVDGKNRGAVAEVCYGYYDGQQMEFFEGSVHGSIPQHPMGESGFGWNSIFIPDGDSVTYAQSGKNFREVTVYPQLKEFIDCLDKA